MAALKVHSLPARETILSPFPTKRRKEILDLLANIIIFPAYLLVFKGIVEGIGNYFALKELVRTVIWIVSGLPILNMLSANIYWRPGFWKRKRVFAISIALLLFFFLHVEYIVHQVFLITSTLLLFEFFLQRLLARNKFLSNPLRPGVVSLVIVNVLLLGILGILILYYSSLYIFIPPWLIRAPLFISIFVITPFPIYFGINDTRKSYKREMRFSLPTRIGFLWRIFSRMFIFICFLSILLISNDVMSVSLLGLALILLVANPNDLISQQRANIQYIFRRIRQETIHQLISTSLPPVNPLARLWNWITSPIKKNIIWFLFIFAWGMGSILLPIFLYTKNIEKNLLILMTIGLVTGFVLASLTIIYWMIQITPKHVVIPFKTINGNEDPGLEVIANLTTQAFVERLKNISVLLNLRQVENLSLRNSGSLAVFVASGQDKELIEQVRALGNIDTKDIKIPFGNLLAPLIANLIETRVYGSVQRKEDRTIAIWVEYQQRDGRTVAVDMAFLPENSALDIDRDTINQIASTLAVKLVFNLGGYAHLASSWKSLQLFINGLDAAYHRNWWHAIACYRKAVHMEEAARNTFGYGYYHLGVMLLFQGEINQGMRYLELAETVGPPLPETQYMLALGRFYQFRNELHIIRSVFADIINGCQSALKLRPDFPEAYHLMATAYYQRGRLRERTYTRYYKDLTESPYRIDPIARGYADDYHKSLNYFFKAVVQYDRSIRRLPDDINALSTTFDEKAQLVQDRMSAAHRLADSLRCLERFPEAEGYYQQMLIAYPRNSRALIDIAKTYCLSGNWGQADQFLRTEVFNHPELEWNKSANFYMGWSQIGGVAENGDPFIRVIDWLIRKYEEVGNRGRITTNKQNKRILDDAVNCLDFAYQQYPAYTFRWRQLDWLPAFEDVLSRYKKECRNGQNPHQVYKSIIDEEHCNMAQLRYWLAWRILGNAYVPDLNILELASSIADVRLDPKVAPLDEFQSCFDSLLMLRERYYEQLQRDENIRSIKNIDRRRTCLALADCGRQQLIRVKDYVTNISKKINGSPITFQERWAMDVFAELSIFTIKLMVEGKAYEYARGLAHELGKILEHFLFGMSDLESSSSWMPLGRKVAYYQLSSLYAWESFSLMATLDDIATQARLEARDGQKINDFVLQDAEALIQKSRNLVSVHPLAIYSQALLNKKLGLFREAADDLIMLEQILLPLDPHKYLSRETVRPPMAVSKDISRLDATTDLSKRERIHGRLQFDNVVNQTQIHITLASVFVSLDEMRLVTDHLMLAISHCPYEDLTAELFLDLTHIFDQQHRFEEALTASEEAKNLHLSLTPFDHQIIKRLEPFILECVLTTNIGEYSIALEKDAQLKEMIQFENFIEDHKALATEFEAVDERVPLLLNIMLRKYNHDLAGLRGQFGTRAHNRLASLCLRSDLLANYLKPAIQAYQDDMIGAVLSSQLIALFSRDLFEQIVFMCDLYNNSAFNWVELNFNLDEAQQDSQKNIATMENLLLSVAPKWQKTNTSASYSGRQLQNLLDPLTWATTNYEKRLANYIDTLAWNLFRNGQPSKLEKSLHLLKDIALHFDPGLAVIYYHLARICVGQLELVWQGLENPHRNNRKVAAHTAAKIRILLRDAYLYWQHAQGLDKNHSLLARLRLVGVRIELYRERWLKYQAFD